jgi:hypothetical protein
MAASKALPLGMARESMRSTVPGYCSSHCGRSISFVRMRRIISKSQCVKVFLCFRMPRETANHWGKRGAAFQGIPYNHGPRLVRIEWM